MGYMNYVYGFIECLPGEDESNQAALSSYSYDEHWPLPRIFCVPDPGRRVHLITFAMAFKGMEDDWTEWLPRFESLLGTLHASYARVDWSREVYGDLLSVEYIFQGNDDTSQRDTGIPMSKWVRFLHDKREHPVPDSALIQKELLL